MQTAVLLADDWNKKKKKYTTNSKNCHKVATL